MDNQLTLNSNNKTTYEQAYLRLNNIFQEIIDEQELPANCIYLYVNITKSGKNAGKETSRSLCILEPSYPLGSRKEQSKGLSILSLFKVNKDNQLIKLTITESKYNLLPPPKSAYNIKTRAVAASKKAKNKSLDKENNNELTDTNDKILNKAEDNASDIDIPKVTVYKDILFTLDNEELYTYIKEHVLWTLDHYEAQTFACCSSFTKCSDAKKCVHENKLYAKGCSYLKNLKAGKIFYGKNKNI